jgi:hypothetical protein
MGEQMKQDIQFGEAKDYCGHGRKQSWACGSLREGQSMVREISVSHAGFNSAHIRK